MPEYQSKNMPFARVAFENTIINHVITAQLGISIINHVITAQLGISNGMSEFFTARRSASAVGRASASELFEQGGRFVALLEILRRGQDS